jgi:hypothetical protein
MGFQFCKSHNFENFKIPNLGVLGQNDIWESRNSQKEYYKGEGGGFPKSGRDESCEFMFAHVLSMHQNCSTYTLTNFFLVCVGWCE